MGHYFWSSIVSLSLAMGILLLGRALLSPAGLLVASLVPTLVGFGYYADRVSSAPAGVLVISFPLVFALGSVGSEGKRPFPRTYLARHSAVDRGWLAAMIFVVPVVALHFSVVGIAVLSDSAEMDRFTLNSGYGGVPSRVVLFVLPILTLAASMRREVAPRAALYLLWFLFVGSRLAMGFKSGLLEVLIMIVVVMMLRGVVLTFRSNVIIASALGAALLYASWVGSKYETIRTETLTIEYLMDRLGRQTAEPALAGLTLSGSDTSPNFLLHDLQFFIYNYVGIGHAQLFPIDQIVSAALNGTPLSHAAFIVPVTIGGPTYLIGSLGGGVAVGSMLLALFAFFLVGRAWRKACRVLEWGTGTSRTRCVFAAGGLLGMRSFIVNGGGGYVLVNYAAATLLAVLLLEIGGRMSGKGKRSGSSASVLVAAP